MTQPDFSSPIPSPDAYPFSFGTPAMLMRTGSRTRLWGRFSIVVGAMAAAASVAFMVMMRHAWGVYIGLWGLLSSSTYLATGRFYASAGESLMGASTCTDDIDTALDAFRIYTRALKIEAMATIASYVTTVLFVVVAHLILNGDVR
jgi:hypothetical protein